MLRCSHERKRERKRRRKKEKGRGERIVSISRIDSRRDRGRDFQSSRLEAELIPGKFKSLESENRSLPPHGRRPRLPEASSRDPAT